MRTTVEITDRQRARLLAIAAERGEKGFSGIVREAIEQYLSAAEEREKSERRRRALDALGTLTKKEAERIEENVRRLRESWR